MEGILVTVGAHEVKVITDVVYTVEVVYSVVDSEVDSETEELVVDVTSPPWVEVGLGDEVGVVVEPDEELDVMLSLVLDSEVVVEDSEVAKNN